MISWHRFKRDIPSFLDKPEEPKEGEQIVPLNMAKTKQEYLEQNNIQEEIIPIQPFVPSMTDEEILKMEKKLMKNEKKVEKTKKPVDKKKKKN